MNQHELKSDVCSAKTERLKQPRMNIRLIYNEMTVKLSHLPPVS